MLRITTRKSPLALWQASHIRDRLLEHWPSLEIELVPLVTSGDKFLNNKLSETGGKGLFVKELEEALLQKRADIAVHSMKDVPTSFPDGLHLAAICTRLTPWDALISKKYSHIGNLPTAAIIGTSSLRRQSQLLNLRPDLQIVPLRGNLQTRIEALQTKTLDAIVLAEAGLRRLGLEHLIQEIFNAEQMLPACGQGALGIECRVQDKEVLSLITPLHDPISALCVQTERHVTTLLGGNCHVPIAVFCQPMPNDEIQLRAKVITPDGQLVLSDVQQGPKLTFHALATNCAQNLLDKGALNILSSLPS